MKLIIEIDLQPNMEQLLIDKINDYCQDWFGKKPVLRQCDVSCSLPTDTEIIGHYEYDFENETTTFIPRGNDS